MPINFVVSNSAGISFGSSGVAMLNGSNRTVSLWVFPRSSGADNDSRFIIRGIFGSAANVFGMQNTMGMIFYETLTGNDKFRIANNNSLTANSWNHVIGTATPGTAATTFRMFVNAIEVGYVFGQDGSGGAEDNNLTNVMIGADSNFSRTFDGILSDIAVWNVILDQSEITLLARSRVRYMPLQVRPSALQGYWPLDDFVGGSTITGTGSTRDRSRFENNGSPFNGTGGASPTAVSEQVLTYP